MTRVWNPSVTPVDGELPSERRGEGSRIFVVEDDGIVAVDIADALKRFGYRFVGRAASADEALRKIEETMPELVLMDVRLKGDTSGITVAEYVRRRLEIPVVFLTASSDGPTIRRALTTEPLGYLVKPFREIDLCAAIELALNRHRAEMAFREREAHLSHASLVDDLTQLHNRRSFMALGEQQLLLAKRTQQPLAVFFFDLDGLKAINDQHGHEAGNRAIQEAGALLRASFRECDLIARLSGDEFAVASLGAGEEACRLMVQRIRSHIASTNLRRIDGVSLALSAGYAVRDPATDESVERLLARADARMYVDKRERRSLAPPQR
jgi:diguanylate cyclase (GGDEF)-like protein